MIPLFFTFHGEGPTKEDNHTATGNISNDASLEKNNIVMIVLSTLLCALVFAILCCARMFSQRYYLMLILIRKNYIGSGVDDDDNNNRLASRIPETVNGSSEEGMGRFV
ncbi:hypothetical protein TIFTF001_000107 [Ficus carica]|uniref:Uncharacterized protein n=1 Tax=Ficus carica TaxID=3494 RepID=A0AA87YW28_FICCA|nr:hypothetical protein TIFTF001_000107 [Ficus carica]